MLQIAFDGSRFICHACWCRINRSVSREPPPLPVPSAQVSFPVPGLTRAANTSRRCMMDNCNNLELRQIPNSIKVYLLSYYRLYIPQLARICLNHLRNTNLEDIPLLVSQRQTDFNPGNVQEIIDMYTMQLEQRNNLDFENINEISAEDLHFWTGLNHNQFRSLLEQTPSLNRRSITPSEDLGVFLCKIRSGEPSIRLATVFNKSRQTIDRKIKLARLCLYNDFVPLYLGMDHITRNQIIDRNRRLPSFIYGNQESPKAILIVDGSYIFIQKSSNFLFQRNSYSLHKFQNLIKPFMLVCGDGYIVDVTGPYAATTSDATIIQQILENHEGPLEEAPINYLLEAGDIFILDRGFRDAVPVLESYGYVPHIPPSKGRSESQLSTEEANKSRLVTMCRWVIEAMNGRFKRDFKLFRHKIFNRALPSTMTDYKIAAALINCFQEPYEDSLYTDQFMEIISRNINKPNLLSDYVLENNLNRQRARFVRMESDDPILTDFPRLTREDLILFALGTYHIKIARSYCSEHIKRTGVYEIELYRHQQLISFGVEENVMLVRCRIQSRHVRSLTYYTYILCKREDGRHALLEHYCSCIHGKRTLGSCAHVISVIYYLGWARHQANFEHPALFLENVTLDIENM